jgi:excisionase family DNA binding protein
MILTVAETAKLLKVNDDTVRRLARTDKIPARKIGKSWRFWQENIENWVRSQEDHACSSSESGASITKLTTTSAGTEYANLLELPTRR